MNDTTLQEVVDELLAKGQLPCHRANSLVAAYGDDQPCDVCGQPVTAESVVYTSQFCEEDGHRSLSMHFRCFQSWEHRLTVRRGAGRAVASG